MCKVIAICNQKGGVSKTTTTVNLGVGLVREGKKVLVIDADPQGNLSQSLGIMNPDELDVALPDIMEQIIMDKDVDVTEGIVQHEEGLDLMPCNINLSGVDVSLVNAMSREFVLKTYVESMREFYDYILIDCMPSLGMITVNSLTAADSVLIPVQANTIKQLSVDGKLDAEMLERYLSSAQKQNRKKEITLKNERLAEYFEEKTTEEEMMNIIFGLLDTWKQKKGSGRNE